MKVGVVGLGAMGSPMALNLLDAGHELLVYDLSSSAVAALVAKGARAAVSPREAAAGVVHVVLDDGAERQGAARGDVQQRHRAAAVAARRPSLVLHRPPRRLARARGAATSRLLPCRGARGLRAPRRPRSGSPRSAWAAPPTPSSASCRCWRCARGPWGPGGRCGVEGSARGTRRAPARATPSVSLKLPRAAQANSNGIFRFGEDAGAGNVVKLCGNFLIASAIEAIGDDCAARREIGPRAAGGDDDVELDDLRLPHLQGVRQPRRLAEPRARRAARRPRLPARPRAEAT